MGGSAVLLIHERVRETELRHLTHGWVGYATSLGATGEAHGLGQTLCHGVPSLSHSLVRRGAASANLVDAKRTRKLPA